MKVNDLIKGLEIIMIDNERDLDIKKVCYNSRDCGENSLFVANKGRVTDGHKFLSDAIERGAQVLVVSDPIDTDLMQVVVEDTRLALAIISDNFYNHPSKELTMIGITATNGKTSTSMMVDSIFQQAGIENGLIGTVEYRIRDKLVPAILTTPESKDLQGYLREMVDSGLTTCVMEVSSISHVQRRVYGVDFDIVSMNNISKEHIKDHGSFENYWNAKKQLITKAKKGSYVILNHDDPHASSLEDKTEGKVITFSEKDQSSDIFVSNIDISTGFPSFDISINRDFETRKGRAERGNYHFDLSVAGLHSVYNAMAAIGISLAYGLSMEKIKAGLENFTGIERRFQQILDKPYKIFDDHFANDKNIEVTLNTVSQIDYKKLRMVYAIRGNRGIDVNGDALDELAKWVDKLNIGSFHCSLSRDCTGDKDRVSDDELSLFKEKMAEMGQDYEIYENLRDAIKAGIDSAEEGDLILLCGSQGMDFGAKFAYDYLKENYPEIDTGLLEKVLSVRVAGV